MSSEKFVRTMAGTVVIASAALTHLVSEWWLLLTCFVGLNLIQSAYTGFCPPVILARKLGVVKGPCSCARGSAGSDCNSSTK